MLFLIVLPSGISTITAASGQTVNAPTKQNWSTATYARAAARVLLSGTTRLWDFQENTQVVEVQLAAHETRVLSFEIEATKIASSISSSMTTPTQNTPGAASLPKLTASPALWDLKSLQQPPRIFLAPEYSPPTGPNVKALFFEGLTYAGKPSRVFAYLGVPETKPGEKVPGMVLIHGGGGTAYLEWVKLWVARGYAAISMDLNGNIPTGEAGRWTRHEWAGPAGINLGAASPFSQIEMPLKEQWTYDAVANVLLAHSLLRSQLEVDADRIGTTGVSWGGYLTSIVAGVDERFKFAAPVYGCGFLTENSTWLPEFEAMGKEKTEAWRKLWDPSQYLPRVKIPMLWLNGTNDFAYPLDSWQKSYRLTKDKSTLCVRVRMEHGHGSVSEAPEEIHAFANQLFKSGPPLARIINQGRKDNDVWTHYENTSPTRKAEINFTTDTGKWQDRNWSTLPAQLDCAKNRANATLPNGAAVYYFNLIDERGLIVSTPHKEFKTPSA
jgi:cephalosporin-C deacetylase-like acetyl esterase